MGPKGAVALLVLGVFLVMLGFIQLKGGKRAKRWVSRVLVLVLFGGLGLLLDAPSFSLLTVGLGVAIGALVLATWFKPWRSD